MTLRETIVQTPYKAGVIAAAAFHTILRLTSQKRSSWIGSGGYFGLIGLLIPYVVEKKSMNPTVKAFACGWRNCFVFLAIGENLFWVSKTIQDRRAQSTDSPSKAQNMIPVIVTSSLAVLLAFKAESSSEYFPVTGPALSAGSNAKVKTPGYRVVVTGKKQYLLPHNPTPKSQGIELSDGKGNVLHLTKRG